MTWQVITGPDGRPRWADVPDQQQQQQAPSPGIGGWMSDLFHQNAPLGMLPFSFPSSEQWQDQMDGTFMGFHAPHIPGMANSNQSAPPPEGGYPALPAPQRPSFEPTDPQFQVDLHAPRPTPYEPEQMTQALTLPAPTPHETDPSLQARVDYQTARRDRLRPLFEQYMQGARQDDWSDDPWWARLGRIAGRIADQDSLAQAGIATEGYFNDEASRRQAIREAALRMGLTSEELEGDIANAGFDLSHGTWATNEQNVAEREAVDRQNLANRYNLDLTNLQERNAARRSNIERSDAVDQSEWSAEQNLALSRYAEAQQRLDNELLETARLGGTSGFSAYGSMLGDLPPELQSGAMEQQARASLSGVIESAMGGDTGQTGFSRVHRRMEQLAGRRLARPSRRQMRTMDDLVNFYVREGVPLSHPEIQQAFPGFTPPVPTRRTITQREGG